MALILTDLDAPEGFERLILAEDAEAKLRGLICVHSTVLGPAAGGCRMWSYASDAEAIADVTRLARGMTYKNAMADLGLGGGKSVIIGNARQDKTPAMLRAFGRAVDTLAGRYYTAEDVGMSTADLAIMAEETKFAVGLEGGSGDPSPWTAEGVFRCLKVGAGHVFGSDDLTGRRVLVQGLGHVGLSLAEKLHAAGAVLTVTDINDDALADAKSRLGAVVCAPEAVFEQDMDIFAPCALGGILNVHTVPDLTAKLVCGAANNQLAEPKIADMLRDRGIRYLPDYVVNAGGIISVAGEIHHRGENYRRERLAKVADRIGEMLVIADREGKPTVEVADAMVDRLLADARSAGR